MSRCKKVRPGWLQMTGAGEDQWNVKACDRPSQQTAYSFGKGKL